jgi:hypothetical protein
VANGPPLVSATEISETLSIISRMPARNIVVVCSGSHEKKVNLGEILPRTGTFRRFGLSTILHRRPEHRHHGSMASTGRSKSWSVAIVGVRAMAIVIFSNAQQTWFGESERSCPCLLVVSLPTPWFAQFLSGRSTWFGDLGNLIRGSLV